MRLRKLPVPKQRPDGQWVVRWRYKVNGREHRPARLFPTERAANEWILANLKAESQTSPADRNKTFAHYAEAWLKAKERKLKRSTVNGYRDALTHALVYFKDRPIGDITPADADAFATWLTDRPTLKTARSIHWAWHPFRATLKHAVRLRAILTNPADGVELPSLGTAEERAERYHFLRPEEVTALASEMPAPYDLLVLFSAYTGLRRAEVTGLDIRHVTLTPPTAAHRSWRGRVRVEVNLKSKHSRRTVPLPGWLAERMAEYLRRHPFRNNPDAPLWPNRKRGGYTYGERKTAKPAHGAIDYSTRLEATAFYRNVFRPAVKRAGLPEGVRFHDLRHTYASLLAAAGERAEVIAKLMGHADAAITLKIYTHLWPEHLDEAAARLAPPPAPSALPATAGNVVRLRRLAQ